MRSRRAIDAAIVFLQRGLLLGGCARSSVFDIPCWRSSTAARLPSPRGNVAVSQANCPIPVNENPKTPPHPKLIHARQFVDERPGLCPGLSAVAHRAEPGRADQTPERTFAEQAILALEESGLLLLSSSPQACPDPKARADPPTNPDRQTDACRSSTQSRFYRPLPPSMTCSWRARGADPANLLLQATVARPAMIQGLLCCTPRGRKTTASCAGVSPRRVALLCRH